MVTAQRCVKCSGMMFIEHTYTERRNITCWRCFNCGKYIEAPCYELDKISGSWFLPTDRERIRWQAIDKDSDKLRKQRRGMVRAAPLMKLIKSLELWIEKDPSDNLKKLLKNAQDNLKKLREDC